jgi:UDP-N-acetylmuramate dehydrogenase
VAEGLVARAADVPRLAAEGGAVKLAAGWLIERAGIARGFRRGPVGISSKHALALVHHGGGTTAALLALACEVRDAVEVRFGVRLVPEPTLLAASLE